MIEVEISRLSAGTVFKLVAIGLICSVLPLTIIAGITASFGFNSLLWNGEPITGTTALIAGPFIGLFMVGMFTMLLGTAIAFGLWLYSFVGSIEIAYKLPVQKPEPTPAA